MLKRIKNQYTKKHQPQYYDVFFEGADAQLDSDIKNLKFIIKYYNREISLEKLAEELEINVYELIEQLPVNPNSPDLNRQENKGGIR